MTEPTILLLLLGLGMITGFIGTNSGGSVFITVPIMMALGIPAPSAIANSRIASIGTMMAGIWQFHKAGKVDYRLAINVSFFAIIGAVIGAHLMLRIPITILEKIIGVILLIFVALSLFSHKIKFIQTDYPISMGRKIIAYVSFLFAGAIGGFFGAQSKLATFIFQIFFNKSIAESLATRKVSGLAIMITASIIYGVHGIINWSFSMALMLGTLIGSYFGTAFALKKGERWMNVIFHTAVILIALLLLTSNFIAH